MNSESILTRALVYGALVTLSIAVAGSILGYLVAGVPGLVSAIIGSVLTAIFMGSTVLSILIANRATKGDSGSTSYFAIVLGMWLVKFVLVLAILFLLRGQPFLDPVVMFFAMIAAVLGGLTVDILVFVRTRVPYT